MTRLLLGALAALPLAAQTQITFDQLRPLAAGGAVLIACLPPGTAGGERCVAVPLGAGIDPANLPSFREREEMLPRLTEPLAAHTLAELPQGPLRVYRNGLRLRLGDDFTLSGQTVIFAPGAVPQPGDDMVFEYRW
jgi:hypothetical protein